MRMYDIILQKRGGGALTEEQIRFVVEGCTTGAVPDYQLSALLMAIFLNGMDDRETACLTQWMARSGDQADLSSIPGVKVDKHSTGGVGDKTSLVIGPVVAACGVPVAKMSGRGLGHTGGTVDKLESIPGYRTTLNREEFLAVVREVGISMIGQSGSIAPADKKLYALRDVTATVDSLPLIASSIMSKKLASGADAILLDVKTGSGAFMKTLDESIALARAMVAIGENSGRRMAALITEMDRPLGYAIGNSLEVVEAVETLRGHGPADLTEVCLELAAGMLSLADGSPLERCRARAGEALVGGAALAKFRAMVAAQGGDPGALDNLARLPSAPVTHTVAAPEDGWIARVDSERYGLAAGILGAGRDREGDPVDFGAGIVLRKTTGCRVAKGEPLAVLHTAKTGALKEAEELLLDATVFSPEPPPAERLVYARVTRDGVERYE